MPQKMIYVAEADLPTFERAQQLAGSNLSAVIARALRLFVQTEEAKNMQLRDVTVAVGTDDAMQRKQFRGRLLARHREHTDDHALVVRIVYLTAKGQLALYTKTIPDWSAYTDEDWTSWDWSTKDYRLEVYESLEALEPHIPRPLYVAAARKLEGGTLTPDVLDI